MKYSISMSRPSIIVVAMTLSNVAMAQGPTSARPEQSTSSETVSDGDIVVTARRVAENLQSVPMSITAVSPETIRSQAIIDVSSLQRIATSFTFVPASRGPTSSVPMIRGQRTQLIGMLNEPAVAVYFAEVGSSYAAGNNVSFYDLSSVQVLKGPQGTLFGRNSTGGAVLITPQAPTDNFEGYVQAATGSYRLADVEAALNIPLAPTLAVRVAGKVVRRRGYMVNPYRDDRANNLHSDDARISLRWTPSPNFESTTLAYYSRVDVDTMFRTGVILPSRVNAAVPPSFLTDAANRIQAIGKYEYDDSFPQYSKAKISVVQNSTEIKLGSPLDLSLKNIVAYRNVSQYSRADSEGVPADLILSDTESNSREFSEELQLRGKTGNLSVLLGGYYYRLNGREAAISVTFRDLASLSTNFPSFSYSDFDVSTKTAAGFAHADYKLDALLEGLSISAGVRYTRDSRGVVYHNRLGTSSALGFAGPFRCNLTGVVAANDRTLCSVTAPTAVFKKWTYDGTVNWQINPDVMIYGAIRRGYRSGGYNASPSFGQEITSFAFLPEIDDEIEAGLKGHFRMGSASGRFSFAVFRDNGKNLQRQINAVLPGTAIPIGRVVNASSARIDGGEAELVLEPTKQLTLTAAGSIISPKYKSFVDFYSVSGVLTPVDVSDSKFSYVPKYQLNASAKYRFPIKEEAGDASVLLNYSYRSGFETTEINSPNCGPNGLYTGCTGRFGYLPGYGTLDARLDWRNVAGQGFDVGVLVTNVTNKYYRITANNVISSFGFAPYGVGEPRMVRAEVRIPFGS